MAARCADNQNIFSSAFVFRPAHTEEIEHRKTVEDITTF
jgi:hypothetical protein